MCLWTSWTHTGDVISTNMSRIVALHVEAFCQGISSAADLQRQAHFYAMAYLEELNQRKDATDLWQFEVGQHLKVCMRADMSTSSFGDVPSARGSSGGVCAVV